MNQLRHPDELTLDTDRSSLFDVLVSGGVAAYELHLDSNQILWSQNLEALHGLEPGDPVDTLKRLQSRIHPEDWTKLTAAISEAADHGERFHVQYRYTAPDGTMRWFETHGQVRRISDCGLRRLIGICIDVTDRQRSEVRLTVQFHVTRILAESEDPSDASPRILETICGAMGWEVGEYWQWSVEKGILRKHGHWCGAALEDSVFGSAASDLLFEPGIGLPGKAWDKADSVWVPNLDADPGFRRKREAAKAGLRAAFAFPVRGRRDTSGVMVFLARDATPPDADLLEMLDALGHQVGSFVERRAAETAVKIRAAQQTAVAQLGLLALSRPELSTLLNEAVARIASTLNVDFVKVLELQSERGTLLLRAGIGWKSGLVGQATLPADAGSQAGYTLQASGPVIVDDLSNDSRFKGPKLLLDHEVVSGMSVIIGGAAHPFGVVGVHSKRRRKFSVDDSIFIQSVANVLAMAIEARRADEIIRQLSTPVLPFREHLLILPLVGVIDVHRMKQVSDQLLESVRDHRARAVVVDATGVPWLEPDIAQSLVTLASSTRLLGAELILTGVSGELARALTDVKVDINRMMTLGDLRSGIDAALELMQR